MKRSLSKSRRKPKRPAIPAPRCFGCGAAGKGFCCVHCAELVRALEKRIAKLRGTVEGKFARRSYDV